LPSFSRPFHSTRISFRISIHFHTKAFVRRIWYWINRTIRKLEKLNLSSLLADRDWLGILLEEIHGLPSSLYIKS
jgi:hypothetical protein